MSSYKRLGNGTYACTACDLIFDGPAAFQDCKIHRQQSSCRPETPALPDRNTRRRNKLYRSNVLAEISTDNQRQAAERRLRDIAAARFTPESGDGYTAPDEQGRWRHPQSREKQLKVEVNKAWHALDIDRANARDQIDRLIDGSGRASTPLARLAYAYNVHNWPLARQAAYDLALDEAVLTVARELLAGAAALFPGSPADVATSLLTEIGLSHEEGPLL